VEVVLAVGGTFSFGLVIVSSLANWLNGLTASLLGASLIARERENQTWTFLRLTTLSTTEIVGGKFAALAYSTARPAHLVLSLRLLAVAAGLVTVALAVMLSGLTLAEAAASLLALSQDAQWPVMLASTGLGLLASLAFWAIEPYFTVLYNGLVGLAGSSLATSRGSAIVVVVAIHFGLSVGLYGLASQFLTLMAGGLLSMLPDLSGPAALLFVVLQGIVQWTLRLAVMAAAVAVTFYRVERLEG
jgi:hypothetical protein